MNILISVVIPVFNASETIITTISSVLKQTVKPYEIILINDGSIDDSLSKISKSFKNEINSKFIILINKENEGVSISRNLGIKIAKGNWIAFLDSDDQWDERKLEQQVICFNNHPECKLFGTFTNVLKFHSHKKHFLISYNKNLIKNHFATSTVLVNRETLINVGLFNEKKIFSEDYELWLNILYKYKFGLILNQKLVKYETNNRNKLSKNYLQMVKGEIDNYKFQYDDGRISLLYYIILFNLSLIKFSIRIIKNYYAFEK